MPDSAKATFYIAVLLYEARAESGDEPPLYQESFVLLRALCPALQELRRVPRFRAIAGMHGWADPYGGSMLARWTA